MPLLPRRFERLRSVLNHRMGDLTVVMEQVDSTTFRRSCAPATPSGCLRPMSALPAGRTFNNTARAPKWVPLHHPNRGLPAGLKGQGFRIYGPTWRRRGGLPHCDFTIPAAS